VARRKLWLAGAAGAVVAAAVGVVIWQATDDDRSTPLSARPAPNVALEQLVEAVGGQSASVGASGYRYLKKLDSSLVDVAASRLDGGKADGADAAERQGVTTSAAGDVLVDVYVTGEIAEAEKALRALGMHVTAVSDLAPQRMVEGYLPADALAKAAKLAGTRAVLSTVVGIDAGGTLSQGDAAIHGPAARALGATGTGVAVGIISDSIDKVKGGIGDSQATGDLPATVAVLLDAASGTDEGRAMAEIVFDEAPSISRIAFSSGGAGAAAKAASIDNLVSNGVNVIADDIYLLDEPFFQDGIVSQAVDRAKAAGVAYFVSAGNRGRQSWEGTYSPVSDPSAQSATTADFDPGAGIDSVQTIATIPADRAVAVQVQWAEPWGRALTDLAVDVYEVTEGEPVLLGTVDTPNTVTGIPRESVRMRPTSQFTMGIAIRRVSGTAAPFIKYILSGMSRTTIEHATNSSAVNPDAASANGSMTVAASYWKTPTQAEAYSSRGPVRRFFDVNGVRSAVPDVRTKPNVAAPDGVATTVPSLLEFFGTSAAAPAAAGIAALMLSADPTLGVDELYAIMADAANVSDCPASGEPDPDCGIGFSLADKAVEMTRARST
jgi:hypothetical protein